MWPNDMEAILSQVKKSQFGDSLFVCSEVIDLTPGGAIQASEYTHIGRVTEFKYGACS